MTIRTITPLGNQLLAKTRFQARNKKFEPPFHQVKIPLNLPHAAIDLLDNLPPTDHTVSIGRAPKNQVQVVDFHAPSKISRFHLFGRRNPEGQLIITDPFSEQGTTVNENKLPLGTARIVHHGDEVILGKTLSLTIRDNFSVTSGDPTRLAEAIGQNLNYGYPVEIRAGAQKGQLTVQRSEGNPKPSDSLIGLIWQENGRIGYHAYKPGAIQCAPELLLNTKTANSPLLLIGPELEIPDSGTEMEALATMGSILTHTPLPLDKDALIDPDKALIIPHDNLRLTLLQNAPKGEGQTIYVRKPDN